ncbi:hypothetical protein GCM10028806_16150 [Spirosoma terrae]|uniref:PIN domain-containing protein n=1 Tax=Spirosoma terrae TaxID=1968276 RepID=A0A6L9L7E8_9BACT|nr:PIN domain-containing protein [Spirosoma terrae]NDU95262.1 PIN domain-containing protein [Spirosoma terrae]
MSANNLTKEGFLKTDDYNEYTVGYWRKRFTELRPQLKRNWHSQLAEFEPALDSLKGANEMRAVSHGKASLVVTQRIVNELEKMLSKKPGRRRINRTPLERLNLR